MSASGERRPGSRARTAPAPMRSSRHGRRVPYSHRSPAGMIAKEWPAADAARATAVAFLRQAVKVGAAPLLWHSVLPLGEGKTRRDPAGIEHNEAGDRLYAPAASRLAARSARRSAANALADSSRHGNGKTVAPLETAMSTAVENDRTSTMMTTSLTSRRACRPSRAHSHRTSYRPWSKYITKRIPKLGAPNHIRAGSLQGKRYAR